MAIGERIRFIRNLCGMTQKYLGQVVGFPEKTADIRMAQYESGSRTPKVDLTNKLAEVFDISPQALSVPDIDSYIGLMHTLFTLEDIYGLTVSEADGEVCLKVNKDKGKDAAELLKMLCAWKEQADKLSSEEISREELEAACGKCTHVRVSDTQTLSQVLDSMNLKYSIHSETEADIYAEITISKLTLALAEKSCELYSVQEKEESLESYYISLVGGLRHD